MRIALPENSKTFPCSVCRLQIPAPIYLFIHKTRDILRPLGEITSNLDVVKVDKCSDILGKHFGREIVCNAITCCVKTWTKQTKYRRPPSVSDRKESEVEMHNFGAVSHTRGTFLAHGFPLDPTCSFPLLQIGVFLLLSQALRPNVRSESRLSYPQRACPCA